MEIHCRIVSGLERDECVLAAMPRVGDTIRGILGHNFRVDQVSHIVDRRVGDPHAIVFATPIEHTKIA